MTLDNLIVIKGGAYNDIKKALRQWIDLSTDALQNGLAFELYKNGQSSHIIKADIRLDNEQFFYLVNYLKYPEGIDYKIDIEGFTTGREKNIFKDKQLLVYISPYDVDGDNVSITTSDNKNYKLDFGGKISEAGESKRFSPPTNLTFDSSEIFKVNKEEKFQEEKQRNTNQLEKRFKIGSLLILIILPLIYLILKDRETVLTVGDKIGFAVWAWFIFDYKLLQINKYNIGCFALSALILLFGYFLESELSGADKSGIGMTFPIVFLILQRPVRFAFKGIMKREPVVDTPAPSFADFAYIFMIWMASILIPIVYL